MSASLGLRAKGWTGNTFAAGVSMSGSNTRRARREWIRKQEKTLRRLQRGEEAGREDWKRVATEWVPAWARWIAAHIVLRGWISVVGIFIRALTSDRYIVRAEKEKWGRIRILINIALPRIVARCIHAVAIDSLLAVKRFFITFGIRTDRKLIAGNRLRLRIYAWWVMPVFEKTYPV